MTYHICNFDRIPNTLKGPTKPNQTKPASPSTSNPSWLSVAKSRLVCTVFVWSLLGLWSEEIIHLPLNPKPPKSDATARELNSERFLGSFVVLVGGTVPRGQRGFGGEGGEGGGEATYPMFMFLFGLGCGNCDYYPGGSWLLPTPRGDWFFRLAEREVKKEIVLTCRRDFLKNFDSYIV